MEIMLKDNLDTKKVSDVESKKLETSEGVEPSVGFEEEISERVDEETGGGLDMTEETIETVQGGVGNDDSEGKEIIKETREVASELVGNKKETIEKINAEEEPIGQDPKTESAKEIENWKGKDEKERRKDIEDYRGSLEKEGLLAEGESIEGQIGELMEKTEKFAAEMAEAGIKLREQLGSVDMSKIEESEQGKAREMINGLAENARNNLNVEQLEWLSEFEKKDFGDLMGTHKNKELTIEELKTMADDLENLDAFLKKFEAMAKDEKKEAQDEIIAFSEVVGKLLEDPWTKRILIAAGVLVGLKLLFIAAGIGVAAWPVWLTAELAAEVAVKGAATIVVGAAVLRGFTKKELVGKVGKVAAFGTLGAGALAAGWFFNKENWDKFVKGISKADYPFWYGPMKALLGLGNKETSKT